MTARSGSGKPVTIFLIDDDRVDRMAVRRAFRKAAIGNTLIEAGDGIEALDKLRQGQVSRPFVILLDVNMPRLDGHGFLRELRADASLTDSVVFMLTTSDDPRDIEQAYKQHVAGYVRKGHVSEDFLRVVALLDTYVTLVLLPE